MKNEVDEMEKKVAIADAVAERERQARVEAEAMLARERKARVESDARVFALENAFKDMKSKYDELAALMEKYMTKQPILNYRQISGIHQKKIPPPQRERRDFADERN